MAKFQKLPWDSGEAALCSCHATIPDYYDIATDKAAYENQLVGNIRTTFKDIIELNKANYDLYYEVVEKHLELSVRYTELADKYNDLLDEQLGTLLITKDN